MIKAIQHQKKAHEVCFIANRIGELIDGGIAPAEIAVIYRKNSNGEELLDTLIKRNIPVVSSQKKDVLDNPYIEKFIKFIEYIQLELQRPMSGDFHCYEILQFDQAAPVVNEILKTVWADKVKWGTVEYFQNIVKLGAVGSVSDIMSEVFNRYFLQKIKAQPDYINILNAFNCFFSHVAEEMKKDRVKNLKDLLNIIHRMQHMDIPLTYYSVFGINSGVSLMTAHASKGLEFEHVFVMDAISTNWEAIRKGPTSYGLPDTLTISIDEEQADRRLFYVAITRAKRSCEVHFSVSSDDNKLLQPSRFVHELNVPIAEAVIPHNIEQYLEDKLAKTQGQYTLIQEKEFVADILETYKLSPSHLNAYLDCPYGFYHNYVLRIPSPPSEPMMYGNAIHNTLQKFYEKYKEGERMTLAEVLAQYEVELMRYRNSLGPEALDRRIQTGIKTFESYYPVMETSNHVTVNEFTFDVVIEGVPCYVKIDKMEFDGYKVNVIDYKTGKVKSTEDDCQRPDEKSELGGKIWRQLMFYKIAMDYQKQFPYSVQSCSVDIVDVRERKLVHLDYNLHDINMVTKLIMDVYGKIKNQQFSEGCGECRWCKAKIN